MSARRDAVRVLLRIAFRNLAASRVRTIILGAIVLVGSLIVVMGSSVLESIDRGMRTSIQGSLGGQVQVYDARSEGSLELWGGLRGPSLLEPIEDFAKVKEVLSRVPNVKQVVPMGIDRAMVSTGNTFDVGLEKLRDDLRRMEAGDEGAERTYEAHKAHLRRMTGLLKAQLAEARKLVDLEGRDAKERRREWEGLLEAASDGFWDRFEKDHYASIEFLENRVAPLAMENAFTFIRYVGTDVDAFFHAFPLAEVVEGERIPPGRRGILIGKQFAEEWLKLKNAWRLDQIKDARDGRGWRHRRIAKDEELQRWVRENGNGIREILLQLDPIQADAVATDLRAAMHAAPGVELESLLARLFATTDEDFDAKYRMFYDVVAPRLRLYRINIGDTIAVKAPSKSGYFSSVNLKVYGFIQFRGIEKSRIAGMMTVMDLMSFRDLYGFMTKEKAEEIGRLKAAMGAKEVDRESAEAELFGSAAPAAAETRSAAIDDRALVQGVGERRAAAADLATHVYGQEEIDGGVALNAALILEDPSLIRQTMRDVRAAADAAGLGLKVIDWQEASGMVGQFVTLLRIVLVFSVVIFFVIALVIINNAMVMATLQRVKEIGTMRAIGAQTRFVVVMLLVEIAAVGLVFGLAGAVLGGGGIALIRGAGGIPAVTDMLYFIFSGPALLPRLGTAGVVVSVAVVLLVAILSALYPAVIAMRVTPVEAMATED